MNTDIEKLQRAINRQSYTYKQSLDPYRRASKFSIRANTKEDAEDHALILSNLPKRLKGNNELLELFTSMSIDLKQQIDQLATDLDAIRHLQILIKGKEDTENLVKHIVNEGGSVEELEVEMKAFGSSEGEEHTANSTNVDSVSQRSKLSNVGLKISAIIDSLVNLGVDVNRQQELKEELKQSSEIEHLNYKSSKHNVIMKFNSGTIQPSPQLLKEVNNLRADLERHMNKRTTKLERVFFYVASLGFLIYMFLHVVLRIL